MQQRKHVSDAIRRLVFRDIRNGASINDLHLKYQINKKTLQSMKEERQDIGRPLKEYLIRKILCKLPNENNQKKLLFFCRRQIRGMIDSPNEEFKKLLNYYNSSRKVKLHRRNRKIIDGIAESIVKIAVGINQLGPSGLINYEDDSSFDSTQNPQEVGQSSWMTPLNHSLDSETHYQVNNQVSHSALIQGRFVDRQAIDDFIDQVLFDRSQSEPSSQLLTNYQDSFNYMNDDLTITQQQENGYDYEQNEIECSSQTLRRSTRNNQIHLSN